MCHHTNHVVYGVLPPQILRNIAQNGSPDERAIALDTLATDLTQRAARSEYQLLAPPSTRLRPSIISVMQPQIDRTVRNCRNESMPHGPILRHEGQRPVSDEEANEAYDGLGFTYDLFWKIYQRNSIDNGGLALNAYVHYGRNYDNAFWDGDEMIFGDGDGKYFNRFTIAIDVIAHELTHGVTGSEINLTYTGQSGALNESISDVFGSIVKQYSRNEKAIDGDWLIGQGLFTDAVQSGTSRPAALRSMSEPGTAYNDPIIGKDPQPDHMSKFVVTSEDNNGVHINSGIPNRAFYLAATAIGGYSWEKAGWVWYDTVRDKQVPQTATFKQFAERTIINAGHRFGSQSNVVEAVQNAWQTVGVI